MEIIVSTVRAAGSDVHHVPIREPFINYSHAQFAKYLDPKETPDAAKAVCDEPTTRFIVAPQLDKL